MATESGDENSFTRPADIALPAIERAFYHVLWLLRNYLPDLVVIGGWVPYLYARFSGDPWIGYQSLTAEVDVLTVPPLLTAGRPRLDETLRDAGLAPASETGPSAVWQAPLGSGEMIEFLTPHRGVITQLGSTVRVSGHGDVGAISLDAAGILAAHTLTLSVPVGEFEGRLQRVDVRVPRLGVYVINKAVTVVARRAHTDGPNPKQAKDLVYLHDVMAASDVVRQRVEVDIRALWNAGGRTSQERQAIRSARNNLGLVLNGILGRTLLPAAAVQLSERDGLSVIDAEARIRGYLSDLAQMLRDLSKRRVSKGPT